VFGHKWTPADDGVSAMMICKRCGYEALATGGHARDSKGSLLGIDRR
jgi:hypothetical protein